MYSWSNRRAAAIHTQVLAELPEPPEAGNIALAVRELTTIGGLTENETLTPLGSLLAGLPIDTRLAKLVLLGVCFGAADEALTIAAALSTRTGPFLAATDAMNGRAIQASRARCDGFVNSGWSPLPLRGQFVVSDASSYRSLQVCEERFGCAP